MSERAGSSVLELPAEATAAMVGFMLHANSLGKASFTARFGR